MRYNIQRMAKLSHHRGGATGVDGGEYQDVPSYEPDQRYQERNYWRIDQKGNK
jgi:hypothetical protein